MKHLLFTSLLVLASIAIEAQTVAVVDFMKVPGNGQDAYLGVYEMLDQVTKTDQIRTIVKSEIWEVLDTTTPKK